MRNLFLLLLALLIMLFATDTDAYSDQRVLIRNVHVIPMDRERVVHDRDVLIEGGRITAIRPTEDSPPEGIRVIDGDGGYLMPGLSEMHAHVPGEQTPAQLREDILALYLANGITLARGMLGEPWHLELRDTLKKGEVAGPRLITSGPSLNGNSVDSPEQGARMVRQQAEAGYDFLKLHPGLDRERFDAIAAAADKAGIGFAGHVSADVGIERALEAGYASIDHLDRYIHALTPTDRREQVDAGFFGYRLAPHADRERIPELAARIRDAGVWTVPTETLMHNVLIADPETVQKQRPEFRYLPDDMIDGWVRRAEQMRGEAYDREAAESFMAVRAELIAALHEAGAGLLLGSDAPQVFNVPGFSLHHEMALMQEAGLTPYQVLRTGTVNPAVFFDSDEEWGQIKEGMRAELVLLAANPLEDLEHARQPEGVFVNGRWYDRDRLDRLLADIEDRYTE